MLCALHKQSYMQILLMHCNCSCIVKRYVCSSAFWQVVLPAPFFFIRLEPFSTHSLFHVLFPCLLIVCLCMCVIAFACSLTAQCYH